MARLLAVFLVGGVILAALFTMADAQTGVPAEVASYRSWTKMNAILMTDPSNPRAGPKNTFINQSPDVLRDVWGPGGKLRKPYADGTIVVRESLHPTEGFVTVLFVQRKDSSATRTRGWVFSGYTRTSASQAFNPLPIPDPVARCLNCHMQMKSTDYVFQPYSTRPDPLPAPAPTVPDRVEIYNYKFGPQTLQVKAGTTVAFANYDAVPHDVKAADRAFESGNLPPLIPYYVTLDRPGTVDYFCAVHLEMRGRIIVTP